MEKINQKFSFKNVKIFRWVYNVISVAREKKKASGKSGNFFPWKIPFMFSLMFYTAVITNPRFDDFWRRYHRNVTNFLMGGKTGLCVSRKMRLRKSGSWVIKINDLNTLKSSTHRWRFYEHFRWFVFVFFELQQVTMLMWYKGVLFEERHWCQGKTRNRRLASFWRTENGIV